MKPLLACLLLVSSATADDQPLATVDGAPVMPEVMRDYLRAQEDSLRREYPAEPVKREKELAETKSTALDTLIDQQLLLNEFKRLGGVIKPELVDENVNDFIKDKFKEDRGAFLADLAKKGLSLEKFRAQRERKLKIYLMNWRIAGDIEITDEEARACLEKYKQSWSRPGYVKIQSVTILKLTPDARRVAEDLHRKILEGADFATIARASSKDSHAEEGGAWDWMPLMELTEEVGNVVAKMRKGELSGVIEQPAHFIIIRLTDCKNVVEPDFETSKEDIVEIVRQEKCIERVKDEIQKLRKAADIQKRKVP
jgi:peptidyl-prolyl cis-trans isomerase SurA